MIMFFHAGLLLFSCCTCTAGAVLLLLNVSTQITSSSHLTRQVQPCALPAGAPATHMLTDN